MLDLIKKVRDELLADSTITDLVSGRIYWAFKPVGNTNTDYPQVTLMDTEGPTDSLFNTYFPDLEIHIWTKGDSKVTRANQIAKRILINIDTKGFITLDPCIYQIWKDSVIEIFEDDTQTFHKVITFNVVMQGYSD